MKEVKLSLAMFEEKAKEKERERKRKAYLENRSRRETRRGSK